MFISLSVMLISLSAMLISLSAQAAALSYDVHVTLLPSSVDVLAPLAHLTWIVYILYSGHTTTDISVPSQENLCTEVQRVYISDRVQPITAFTYATGFLYWRGNNVFTYN